MGNVVELKLGPKKAPAGFLTPREVERRYPSLSRPILASRRAFNLPPKCTLVSGCALYDEVEIQRFLATRRNSTKPSRQRCVVYARADSLLRKSDLIAPQVKFCESFRASMGWANAGATVDFGPPSTPQDVRGGLNSLLKEAETGAFDILLLHDIGHIGRSGRHIIRFIRRLDEAGVHVCEAARPLA